MNIFFYTSLPINPHFLFGHTLNSVELGQKKKMQQLICTKVLYIVVLLFKNLKVEAVTD